MSWSPAELIIGFLDNRKEKSSQTQLEMERTVIFLAPSRAQSDHDEFESLLNLSSIQATTSHSVIKPQVLR